MSGGSAPVEAQVAQLNYFAGLVAGFRRRQRDAGRWAEKHEEACGIASSHPQDIRERYCGACHDWTGQ